MIIIIEGVDGAGKTTLANKLHEMTGWPIVHRKQPKNQEEKDQMYGQYLQDIKSGKNFIYDRAWYSEMVYGPVMRDASYIQYPQMYELEQKCLTNGAMVIWCTGSKNLLWKRCQSRGEDYIKDKDTFMKLYDTYNEVFKSCPHIIPVVTYEA